MKKRSILGVCEHFSSKRNEEITLYSHPDSNSNIVKKLEFSYQPESMPDSTFAILLNEKQLGFLYVSDIGDGGKEIIDF